MRTTKVVLMLMYRGYELYCIPRLATGHLASLFPWLNVPPTESDKSIRSIGRRRSRMRGDSGIKISFLGLLQPNAVLWALATECSSFLPHEESMLRASRCGGATVWCSRLNRRYFNQNRVTNFLFPHCFSARCLSLHVQLFPMAASVRWRCESPLANQTTVVTTMCVTASEKGFGLPSYTFSSRHC